MAVITETLLTGTGAREVIETTLGASDTLTFKSGSNQVLTIRNDTAGAITPNIVGDSATTVSVSGYGSVDVSGGYTTPSIAVGETFGIPLDSIRKYLSGDVVTVTGGDGAIATLTGY
jgi:H+/Cl- antiporter ClcA